MTTAWWTSGRRTGSPSRRSADQEAQGIHHRRRGQDLRVDMGKAILDPKQIPVDLSRDKVVDRRVTIGMRDYRITCVSMGSLAVVFVDSDIDHLDLEEIGPMFENDPHPREATPSSSPFSTRTSSKCDRAGGQVRTWACGTGACTVAVTASRLLQEGRRHQDQAQGRRPDHQLHRRDRLT